MLLSLTLLRKTWMRETGWTMSRKKRSRMGRTTSKGRESVSEPCCRIYNDCKFARYFNPSAFFSLCSVQFGHTRRTTDLT
ncbi:uncharacterized protein LAESUDRAFT_433201 [Laetiporus sulphureus 93-53]|uniref:Uncharacterized protein n=1 Tax=Laetiporus sulphureus 93-53 TaxID=1314785 RepID=A0A165C5T7_9APHY|nr:uncharacterized protein LAESUDRAFT_433201 [Laetiporus sulphureus 93-53]KZT02254.1 hypothetical protein LAESUDRAFT_433201 [Laetiporus sulphureus 93-53]